MTDLVCVNDFEKYAYKNLPRNALDYYRSGAGQQKTLSDNKVAFSNQTKDFLTEMGDLICVDDFEKYAYKNLPRNALDYYRSGAGQQRTLSDNKIAFSKYKIRPRCLRDVSVKDLSTVVLGEKVAMPIGISPTAMQRMAHPDGECANARAAQALGTVYTLSTLATSSIEEVAEAAPHALKWFQLYIYRDRELTKALVKRAEKAGFKALVLTVDAPVHGIRLADVRNHFSLPPHLSLANFNDNKSTDISKSTTNGSGLSEYHNLQLDPSMSWSDIKWLRTISKLPIVVKGIMTAEDALLCADAQVAAVVVSNHGARQVDGTASTIEVLPEITKAVGDKLEVYIDGGITDGSDVFKALALGARMVFVGRPALWGLSYNGEEGVKKVLSILKKEFETTLLLTGCNNVNDIHRSMVVHKSYYSKL